MTDGGTLFQPGAEGAAVPFQPRSAYAGFRAFGGGDGAVLIRPRVAGELRNAAELATRERRVTGGLLYGLPQLDEQGRYLVVEGFLEAGPGENRADRPAFDGTDHFTLSGADLRLLREDGARMYSSYFEVGWWRTRTVPGEFGPGDFATQAALAGPDGVGLLVYATGILWGTAYLGPDGHAPDSAGTLVAAAAAPGPPPEPDPALNAEGELAQEPLPDPGAAPVTPAPWMTPRRASRLRVPPRARAWGARRTSTGMGSAERETPADVRLVVGALMIATVAAAIIIGALASSAVVGLIVAIIGLLAILSTVWMSRR
jgi:hypothetical protein